MLKSKKFPPGLEFLTKFQKNEKSKKCQNVKNEKIEKMLKSKKFPPGLEFLTKFQKMKNRKIVKIGIWSSLFSYFDKISFLNSKNLKMKTQKNANFHNSKKTQPFLIPKNSMIIQISKHHIQKYFFTS